jgi:hypothetical protein
MYVGSQRFYYLIFKTNDQDFLKNFINVEKLAKTPQKIYA